MSSPRDAMSVATRTWSSLSLKRFSARVPAGWLLLPGDRVALDAVALVLLGEPVRAVLGAGEHQHLVPVAGLHQVREQLAPPRLIHRVRDLRDELDRPGAARPPQ